MRRETRFTAISPATWKRVYDRDKGCCVLCGRGGALQCAHFIGRAQGGLGREENLVMLCADCHRSYDQSADREDIRAELQGYLQACYPNWDKNKLIYRKYGG